MIWKWANHKNDRFVTFGHQEARIVALEADFAALCRDLLTYLNILEPADPLADTLRTIIKNREDAGNVTK